MNFLQLRADDVLGDGILNPGEHVLWVGTCWSRRGKQEKSFPRIGPWNYLVLLIVVVGSGAGVSSATGSELAGLLAGLVVLAIAYVSWEWIQEHVRDSDMYCRAQTRYLITNRRAMVMRNCRTNQPVQSLPWTYVDGVCAEQMRLDGRGTVQFVGWDAVAKRSTRPMRFFMVRDAAGVVEEARSAREAARG